MSGTRGRRQTIPVGLVIGHEFVGEVVEVGANVPDVQPGQLVSGEGPCGVRALPELPGGAAASVRVYARGGGESRRGVCGVYRAADVEYLAPCAGD